MAQKSLCSDITPLMEGLIAIRRGIVSKPVYPAFRSNIEGGSRALHSSESLMKHKALKVGTLAGTRICLARICIHRKDIHPLID